MALDPAVSAAFAAKALPPSLHAHSDAELADIAAECWDRWLEAGIRELGYRRSLRTAKARIERLQRRLRFQYAAAHSRTQETVSASS